MRACKRFTDTLRWLFFYVVRRFLNIASFLNSFVFLELIPLHLLSFYVPWRSRNPVYIKPVLTFHFVFCVFPGEEVCRAVSKCDGTSGTCQRYLLLPWVLLLSYQELKRNIQGFCLFCVVSKAISSSIRIHADNWWWGKFLIVFSFLFIQVTNQQRPLFPQVRKVTLRNPQK